MNGFRYWRHKRRMTLQALAQEAGCTSDFLRFQEQEASLSASSALVASVARALNVTMDELFQEYPEGALEIGDHPGNRSRPGGRMLNVMGRYRLAHNLTYREMANQLGQRSPQAARNLCISPRLSRQSLERLAALENLEVEEFLHQYADETENKS